MLKTVSRIRHQIRRFETLIYDGVEKIKKRGLRRHQEISSARNSFVVNRTDRKMKEKREKMSLIVNIRAWGKKGKRKTDWVRNRRR